ncbi:hypothetical protein ACFPRA_07605 [Sporosarcina soli]|uniref:Uncharacterized protein n=1 Tax=Sporosarcina soli TaxID=334736 RepID=A0ABW0TH34_9BACL
MSFLKGLGSLVGGVVGEVVGGTVKVVGEVTNSDFVREIGDGVKHASYFAGEKLGEAASGTWDIASGIITQDQDKLDDGLSDMGKAIGDTARAAGHTICNVVENGTDVVGGLLDGDNERLKDGAKGIVKVGVVGALSFGVIDLIDGGDVTHADPTMTASPSVPGLDTTPNAEPALPAENISLVENPNSHHVEPHWRTLSDGTEIWVDGDGDSSVNTYEGWTQSNPDYRVKG